MTKAALKLVSAEVRHKRKEIRKLRGELEDMQDLLDLLAARAVDDGKRYSTAEVRQKLKLAGA